MHDLLKISAGKVLNAILALGVNVMVARVLGDEAFGGFALSLSVLIVTLELTCSEAIDNGLVRFASRHLGSDPMHARRFMQAALKLKLGLAGAICVAGGLLGHWIVLHVLHRPALYEPLLFGLAAGCVASLWRFGLAVLQTHERFTAYAALNIAPNLVKAAGVGLLAAGGLLTLRAALAFNVAGPVLGIFCGALLVRAVGWGGLGSASSAARELMRFARWLVITHILLAVYSRADVLILSALTDFSVVGHYSAALSLISVLDLVYVSVLTKMFPTVSRMTRRSEFTAHLRRSLGLSSLLVILVCPLFLVAGPLVTMPYSAEFAPAVPLFRILLLGFLCTLLLNPLILILYARDKPYVFTAIHAVVLVSALAGHVVAIPMYGAVGAAWVVSATRALGGVLVLAGTLYELRRLPESEDQAQP